MSFRARLTLVAAAAVALAVIAASAVVWFVVKDTLYDQVDNRLRARAQEITTGPQPIRVEETPDGRRYIEVERNILGSGGYIQVVSSDGTALRTFEETQPLPVGRRALETAQRGEGTFFSNSKVGETDVRVFTTPAQDSTGRNYAIQVAQPLTDVNHTLDRVTLLLVLIAAFGIGIAVALGLRRLDAALAPVRRLTEASEKVAATRDLSERIDADGRDELSRLALSFNSMLGALEESTRAQRQLVADASHELRTPLTSLRTNIEVLATERTLPPGERQRLLSDVVEQLGEMTTLISELIELAREEQSPEAQEDVRLDLIAADAVERTRRNRPGIDFKTDLNESARAGRPEDDRASSRQPARQRSQMEPGRRGSRGRGAGRRAHRSRPRPGHRSGGPALRLRPLLPRELGSRPARLRPRARDRPPGRPGPRRHRGRGERRGRRDAHADAAERRVGGLGILSSLLRNSQVSLTSGRFHSRHEDLVPSP